MRAVLVAVVVAMSVVSVGAQTPGAAPPTKIPLAAMTPIDPQQTPSDRAQRLSDNLREAVIKLRQLAEAERMRVALGGLSLTADRMVLQQGVVFAENVTITLDGAVITADDAFIQNGEARLGANARVRFSPK